MANVQMNARVPREIREWVEEQAKKDDRNIGYVITRLIRPLIEGKKPKPKPSPKGLKPNDDWIPPPLLNMKAWAEFEQHRKLIKKPLSNMARTKAAGSIINLSSQEQQETIDRSIQAGWAGLFPEKSKTQDNRPFFEKNNESVREQLFGKKGETYEH